MLQDVGHRLKSLRWGQFSREGGELEAAHAPCTGMDAPVPSAGTGGAGSVPHLRNVLHSSGLSSLVKLSGVDVVTTPLSLGGANALLSPTARKSSGTVLAFYLLRSPAT